MEENCKDLLKKFKTISSLKWIKGVNNFTNSAGLTFESLLNKKADSMYFPDYHGIEIKCTQRFSKYPITLFSSSFDGPSLYEMNRLLTAYGKQDIVYRNRKLLNSNLSCNHKVLINNKFYFKIDISNKDAKLYVCVYDLNDNLIERKAFISFETLKTKLNLKLSTLALVYASKKEINNHPYFRYYKMIIYKLISFNKFISLLQKDIIQVEIAGRISRSGLEAGRQRNKNLVFKIPKSSIKLLFNTIEIQDENLDTNFQII